MFASVFISAVLGFRYHPWLPLLLFIGAKRPDLEPYMRFGAKRLVSGGLVSKEGDISGFFWALASQ